MLIFKGNGVTLFLSLAALALPLSLLHMRLFSHTHAQDIGLKIDKKIWKRKTLHIGASPDLQVDLSSIDFNLSSLPPPTSPCTCTPHPATPSNPATNPLHQQHAHAPSCLYLTPVKQEVEAVEQPATKEECHKRAKSERALETEAQEYSDEVDKNIQSKKRRRKLNARTRRRTMRLLLFSEFISLKKVRWGQTQYSPPFVGEEEGGEAGGGEGGKRGNNEGGGGEDERETTDKQDDGEDGVCGSTSAGKGVSSSSSGGGGGGRRERGKSECVELSEFVENSGFWSACALPITLPFSSTSASPPLARAHCNLQKKRRTADDLIQLQVEKETDSVTVVRPPPTHTIVLPALSDLPCVSAF